MRIGFWAGTGVELLEQVLRPGLAKLAGLFNTTAESPGALAQLKVRASDIYQLTQEALTVGVKTTAILAIAPEAVENLQKAGQLAGLGG